MSARTTVHRDPKLLKGQRRRTMEGQMGGSPKALQQQASGKGNQPAGSLSRIETAQFSKQSVANKSRHPMLNETWDHLTEFVTGTSQTVISMSSLPEARKREDGE